MYKIISILILSILLLSCQHDDSMEHEEIFTNKEVIFSVGTDTKAEGTLFDVGDKIGIYVVKHLPNQLPILRASGNYADNKCYKITNEKDLIPASENDKIHNSGGNYIYSIYAYYPYDPTITDPTQLTLEVQPEQSQINRVKQSDFMISKVLYTIIDYPITLIFNRKMSYLNVIHPKKKNEVVSRICLFGLHSKYTINLQTGILGDDCNTRATIAPMCQYKETNDNYYYSIIVPPFEYHNRPIFQITKNGDISLCALGTSLKVSEGSRHNISITEPQRHITYKIILSNQGLIDEGEIYVTNGNECTVATPSYEGYTFSGWFKNDALISTNLNYTFTATEDVYLEAKFQQIRHNINIECTPDRSVLAPYLSLTHSHSRGHGEEVDLSSGIITDSDYVFDGWYENGIYITRTNPYTFIITEPRNLLAKYCIRAFSLGSSKTFKVNEVGYFTETFDSFYNIHPTNMRAGQKLQLTGYADFQVQSSSVYSIPMRISNKKLIIKIGNRTVFETSNFEEFKFTAPETATYTFYYSMSISGQLLLGENVYVSPSLTRLAWFLD